MKLEELLRTITIIGEFEIACEIAPSEFEYVHGEDVALAMVAHQIPANWLAREVSSVRAASDYRARRGFILRVALYLDPMSPVDPADPAEDTILI